MLENNRIRGSKPLLPIMLLIDEGDKKKSSLFSQSGAKVSNDSGTHDPGPDADWSHEEVNSSQMAITTDGKVEASCDGHGSAETFVHTLSIHLDGNVSGMSFDANGHMEAYGGASMVQPGVTAGIFFQITPDAGESYGDLVQIDFNWMGDLSTSVGTGGISPVAGAAMPSPSL